MTEQLSPDGYYRWTGTEWVPTGKVPEPVAAGVRPAAANLANQPGFLSAQVKPIDTPTEGYTPAQVTPVDTPTKSYAPAQVTPVDPRMEGYAPSHHSPHGAD